jgi:sec-independent protein translocase protein TatA
VRPIHYIILILIVLLIFGARRLPGVARSIGQSLKIFKSEVKDLGDSGETPADAAPAPGAAPASVAPTPAAPAAPAPTAPTSTAAPAPEPPAQPGDGTAAPRS